MKSKGHTTIIDAVSGLTERIEVPAFCNVCNLDLRANAEKEHRGHCPICDKITEHVMPFHGCPWHCTEPHANDATACCVCGKDIKPVSGIAEVVSRGLGASGKRVCRDCNPLKEIKLPIR